MHDPSLHQLEREVEAARAKLAGDLSTLRSPATYSEFSSGLKDEALDIKDALVAKAKTSVQSTLESFVDDLKARAAANPAAALAIGAGIAWRMIQHPPIATALVGAGLYSLFRTTPPQHRPHTTEGFLAQAKERLGEQASDFAENVKDRAVAIGEAATEKTTELAVGLKDRAMAVGDAITGKANELAGTATDHAKHWSDEVRSSVRRVAGDATRAAGDATALLEGTRQSSIEAVERTASRATAASNQVWKTVQDAGGDPESRDKFLLGAAGVAVIAALGIACQRRLSEPAQTE